MLLIQIINPYLIIASKFLGQSSIGEDVDDLVSRLRQSDDQVNDLKERLKTATSNVEQYRTMVVNLEESINKEKQVICF